MKIYLFHQTPDFLIFFIYWKFEFAIFVNVKCENCEFWRDSKNIAIVLTILMTFSSKNCRINALQTRKFVMRNTLL
ncbi:MAG: hypothetical protein DRO88_10960 [Promethearchaeia archaeon]|nr:MAG: hypothetical protein DRO88_10960 [Candidatus Lokiarchaeia archaeon]